MVSPYDFLRHARQLPPGEVRTTLLRISLNTEFDPQRFPVDFSEVLALPPVHRAVTWGYLGGCAAHPSIYTRTPTWAFDELCEEIEGLLLQQEQRL